MRRAGEPRELARDGLISRENVWLDGGSVIARFTAPDLATTPA
jgi:hypothetical protein